jgi:hypothetical protein
MAVTYPRKILNRIGPRQVMAEVVKERKLQVLFLNSYRFNEQRSCQELTALIEALNGQPRELVRELSHHISDEARHAVWLTDLLVEMGEEIGNPESGSYIDQLNRLFDKSGDDVQSEDREARLPGLLRPHQRPARGPRQRGEPAHPRNTGKDPAGGGGPRALGQPLAGHDRRPQPRTPRAGERRQAQVRDDRARRL